MKCRTIRPREPFLNELGVMIARIVEKDMDHRQHRTERCRMHRLHKQQGFVVTNEFNSVRSREFGLGTGGEGQANAGDPAQLSKSGS